MVVIVPPPVPPRFGLMLDTLGESARTVATLLRTSATRTLVLRSTDFVAVTRFPSLNPLEQRMPAASRYPARHGGRYRGIDSGETGNQLRAESTSVAYRRTLL